MTHVHCLGGGLVHRLSVLLGYGFTSEKATMQKVLPALCLNLRALVSPWRKSRCQKVFQLCALPLSASGLETVWLVVHSGVFTSLPEIQTLTFLISCLQNENPGAARI